MNTPSKISIEQKFSMFSDPWSPRVVAELNDYQVKLARLEGEFVWHQHEDTDELFYIVAGELVIEFRDHSERLSAGDLLVVPKGVGHRPVAVTECQVMIIEPRGVVNTGDAGGNRTAENDVWI